MAWVAAIERRHGPTCLLFTRQSLPFQPRDEAQIAMIRRGGYVLADWDGGGRRVVVIATGSEVALAMGARAALAAEGIAVRVVSMPCTSVFDAQDADWRASVLPRGRPARRRRGRIDRRLAPVRRRRRRPARRGRGPGHASANRRRHPRCSSISASPSTASPPRCGGVAAA